MFRLLRRLLTLAVLGVLGYAGYLAYLERARLVTLADGAWILYQQARRWDTPPRPRTLIDGQVFKVVDGNVFCLRATNQLVYCFKLAATDAPPLRSPLNPQGDPLGVRSAETLRQFILSNLVAVDVLQVDQDRNGHGFAYVNGTNVSVWLAGMGLATVNRTQIQVLPWREQLELLRAERQARARKLGVWSRGPE
jgi:endonuclease YncB( thermonuclease family)